MLSFTYFVSVLLVDTDILSVYGWFFISLCVFFKYFVNFLKSFIEFVRTIKILFLTYIWFVFWCIY